MKNLHLSIIAMLLAASACIRPEAPNCEADILSCTLPEELLLREPQIGNSDVRIYVKNATDLTRLSPAFELSEGASIEPASGTERDFSTAQTYTVTSEDGLWSKAYTVKIGYAAVFTDFHFDYLSAESEKNGYHIIEERLGDESLAWSSGNAGYRMSNGSAGPEDFPTCICKEGKDGSCARLTTLSTGAFGKMYGAPIAAGNLFLGSFETNLSDTNKSTHMGIPFSKTPKTLSGWFKYKAGDKFTDAKLKTVPGRKDTFNIYAVLFEVTADTPWLDGNNVLTHPNVVSVAQMDPADCIETGEWTAFSIPFQLMPGRSIDAGKLSQGSYSITVVASSSRDGGSFEGAIGSTLYVDELKIGCE